MSRDSGSHTARDSGSHTARDLKSSSPHAIPKDEWHAADAAASVHVCATLAPGGTRCDICFGPVPAEGVSADVTATVTALAGSSSPGTGGEKRDRLIATSSEERKLYPLAEGLMDYFPDALAAVARHSYESNQKHNPGEPMHWARGKSMDHADCIMRHLQRRGKFDGAARESTALAWRALALLQEELEAAYALDLPRAAR